MRPLARSASMIRPIRKIGWSPGSWSVDGTSVSSRRVIWKANSNGSTKTKGRLSRRRIASDSCLLVEISGRRGKAREQRRRHAKKILRTVISEIVVDVVGDKLQMIVHWQGGDHTNLTAKKNRAGHTRWTTDGDIVDLVRALARQIPDETIAALLNRSGKKTGHGNSWTRERVCSLRKQHGIAIYREGERAERGEVTLDEAAASLDISATTMRRFIMEGAIPATHVCKGAPWMIRRADIESDAIGRQAAARRSRRPPPDDRQHNLLDIPET